jgi:acyl-CoA reductase-like NAD-dependent aldehyde dehydrogenase
MLQEIAATIRTEAARLVQILVDEIGKPVSAARAEVERMAITFSLAVHELDNWGDTHEDLTYDPRGTGISAIVRRFPLGPVFAITPYNWPYNLAAHKIAPAIATGCPVIIKGSPLSTLSTLMLSPILQNCGCVQILACDNALAEQIASDDRVAMLSFTGSPSVGWY